MVTQKNFILKLLTISTFLILQIASHGALIYPPSRNAVDRVLPQFVNGKYPPETTGCNCGNAEGCPAGVRGSGNGQPCLWFSQGCNIGCETCDGMTQHTNSSLCNITMEPTINDPMLRTMNRKAEAGSEQDVYRFNPWRAPGSAPVIDACGIAGGATQRGGGEAVFFDNLFAKQGDYGSKVLNSAPSGTVWETGTEVKVAWGIRYNHGGGYSYRLCPTSENLTEECFQKYPLEFNQEKQYLQWKNGTTYKIKGTFVSEGTTPKGSMWAMNPIPRIDFDSHSSGQPAGEDDCHPLAIGPGCRQFDPPCPQDQGWYQVPGAPFKGDVEGECSGDNVELQIVDYVKIPSNLKPGDYVLGWRWDCEETAQIWSNCADVTIIENQQKNIENTQKNGHLRKAKKIGFFQWIWEKIFG